MSTLRQGKTGLAKITPLSVAQLEFRVLEPLKKDMPESSRTDFFARSYLRIGLGEGPISFLRLLGHRFGGQRMSTSVRHAWLRLGPSGWGRNMHPFALGLPFEDPQILAAVQWHVCAGNQARTTSVDLGLGPEPPVLFLRGPWPPITDYYHQLGYLKVVNQVRCHLLRSSHKCVLPLTVTYTSLRAQ